MTVTCSVSLLIDSAYNYEFFVVVRTSNIAGDYVDMKPFIS